jgi:type VI secretion system secreted protein VgrG
MATILSVHFPDLGGDAGPFTDCIVHRALIAASLGAPFEIAVTLHSSDPAVEPHAVVGQRAELHLPGEPHVDRIVGVVRALRQLSSHRSASGAMASYYEVVLTPAHVLARHREGRRVFQNLDALGVVAATFATYPPLVTPPVPHLSRSHAVREYTVQYDENDLDFAFRMLAEDHLASYFDPATSALHVVDDVASLTPALPFRLPYRPESDLHAPGPAALALRFEDGYASGAVGLRDYDFEHPLMSRDVPVTLAGDARVGAAQRPFADETSLAAEGYEVERFATSADGDAIAARDLTARRAGARIIECETNVAIFPGTRLIVEDHPRLDASGELLVVAARIHISDGATLPVGDATASASSSAEAEASRRLYSLRCVRVAQGYLPPRRRRPRAIGSESAFVVGGLGEGQIDVDEHGRVLIEHVWDRRDLRTGTPSRRVRVSQAWAGANRGFVTLPRIGDEVLVGYHDGDPDQPIVVGRVHNRVARTPLDLPAPDESVSTWRSRTVGGDGYNQVLMDDEPGAERLELRAEKTRTDLTQGDESSTVGGQYTVDIGEDAVLRVHGSVDFAVDGDVDGKVGGDTRLDLRGNLETLVGGSARMNADGGWVISGPSIELQAGGASITLGGGKVVIKAASAIIIDSGGDVKITAGGVVDVDGALITLN